MFQIRPGCEEGRLIGKLQCFDKRRYNNYNEQFSDKFIIYINVELPRKYALCHPIRIRGHISSNIQLANKFNLEMRARR